MTLYYSATTGGFYDRQIHSTIPEDAVAISVETHRARLAANAQGARIVADAQGQPQTVFPTAEKQLAAAQAAALSHLTEIAKAQRQQVAGTTDEVEIGGWLNKFRIAQAIQAGVVTTADRMAFEREIQARQRQESLNDFCTQVLKHGAYFAQVMGVIDGEKVRAIAAVAQANTEADIQKRVNDFSKQLARAVAQISAMPATAAANQVESAGVTAPLPIGDH